MTSSGKPVPIRWSQRVDDLRRGPLALALWVGAAVCAAVLLLRHVERAPILGLAQSVAAEVSTEIDGRLVEILVRPFDDVSAGQTIARLDDARVAARLDTASAEIEALEREIESERARLERELAVDAEDRGIALRRLLLEEEAPRLERLQETVQLESDLVERARIESRLGRAEELLQQGLVAAAERDDLALQRDVVSARLTATRARIEALEAAEAEAAARRARFESELREAGGIDDELGALRARVQAARLLVEEIRVERGALTLSSPVAGRVRLHASAGQALLAGEPVATVTGLHADSIVAYLPAGSTVRAGTRVLVTGAEASAEALVTRLGPAVEPMPEQLWLDPARPEFGRPALITGVSGLGLVPGEVSVVRPAE